MSTLRTTTASNLASLGATSSAGDTYFETTNNRIVVWDGSAWKLYNTDGAIVPFANSFTAALDGTNDYLTVPSSTDFDFGTGDFSFTFWMRITSREQYGGLFFRAASYRLKFQNSNHIINLAMTGLDAAVITYNPGGTNTSLLDSWHHIAVIRSGTTLKGYVDNVEYGSQTLTTQSFSASGSPLLWGDNGGSSVGGQLDEIAVFNYALSTGTSSQLTEIYNNGAAFNIGSAFTGSDAPLAFYRCGDDANDTDSGGGSVDNGDTIGTIKNVVNPGTHDMGQVNGATYSNANSPV